MTSNQTSTHPVACRCEACTHESVCEGCGKVVRLWNDDGITTASTYLCEECDR